ncbi:hypothetical protein EDB80DRAFT_550150, partial [Ilyonectria destructans]
MRNDHEIYFNTDLTLVSSSVRRVTELIPGEYPYSLSSSSSPTPSSPPSSTSSIQGPPQATKAEFQSALKLVQEVIGEGRRLTLDLARQYERVHQWRERWGWSPLSPGAYEPPPPYSPPRNPQSTSSPPVTTPPNISIQSSISPEPEPIPNPPILGDAAPDAETLFNTINTFAKEHGFGIVRYNGYQYQGRIIR